jgi:hypothetical protein
MGSRERMSASPCEVLRSVVARAGAARGITECKHFLEVALNRRICHRDGALFPST